MKFLSCRVLIFFVDTDLLNHNPKIKNTINDYAAVQIVSTNKEFFTANEIEEVEKSRQYQELLIFPGTSTFKSYMSNNLIQNYDIYVDDINRANIIYGLSILNIQD